jgi:hypothetical protein
MIYAIKQGDLIKIGYTSQMRVRLENLRVRRGTDFTLIGLWDGDWSDEQATHRSFKAYRAEGREWFRLPVDIERRLVLSGKLRALAFLATIPGKFAEDHF